jgi:hypothetical protein
MWVSCPEGRIIGSNQSILTKDRSYRQGVFSTGVFSTTYLRGSIHDFGVKTDDIGGWSAK